MTRRLHSEIKLELWKDLAGESKVGVINQEFDLDNMLYFLSPTDKLLPAGALAANYPITMLATYLRFIAVVEVSVATGINIHLNASGNDAILVKPSTGTNMEGFFVLTTSATSIFLSNPSSTADVQAQLMLGFSETA